MLTTEDVANMVGVKVNTIRQYRLRGVFPAPDGHVGRTPWWKPETVTAWQATRRPGGRPKKALAPDDEDQQRDDR